MHVCLCVSRLLKTIHVKSDQQQLLPFSYCVLHLLSILLIGRALVTKHIVNSCQTRVGNAVFAVHFTIKAVYQL